jgi:hypothetical protein
VREQRAVARMNLTTKSKARARKPPARAARTRAAGSQRRRSAPKAR